MRLMCYQLIMNKLVMCLVSPAWVLAALSACTGDGKEDPAAELRIQVSLASEWGAAKTFSASDAVQLYDLTSGDKDTQSPLQADGTSAYFPFSLRKASPGDVLAGVLSSGDDMTVTGKKASYRLAPRQTGAAPEVPWTGNTRIPASSSVGTDLVLSPQAACVRARVPQGDYSIVQAVLKAVDGEKVSGDVTLDLETGGCTASTASVTVSLATPLDCSQGAQEVDFFIVPGTLMRGVSVSCLAVDGQEVSFELTDKMDLPAGSLTEVGAGESARKLIIAGGTRVRIISEAEARQVGDYKAGLQWEWNAATAASTLGQASNRMDHIDDAKLVDGGAKLLITSSYGWCVLLDVASKSVDFWATGLTNAHSAALLPGGYIAVACSDGFVALYDRSRSNVQLAKVVLESAHGVVWNETKQRLYAVGGTSLMVLKVGTGTLVAEQIISTSSYVTGCHDLSYVDEGRLLVAGKKMAFYDVQTMKFTAVHAYDGVSGFKSANYNPETGELYYTYAWSGYSEGAYSWSSHWIRYTSSLTAPFSLSIDAQGLIRVEDINMYKVRVYNW